MSKNDDKKPATAQKPPAPKKAPAAKKAARQEKWAKVGIKVKALGQWAEDAVLKAAQEHADESGEARAKAAVDALAKRIDEAINPPSPIGEAISDAAIWGGRVILEAIVEGAFERLRSQGRA